MTALFLTCRDTPRDNPFDPDTEVLVVEVLSPPEGRSYTTGHPVRFEVAARTAFDNQPAGDSFLWKSDISGTLSRQRSFTASLTAGTHRISVSVTGAAGRAGSRSFLLKIRSATEFGVELVVPSADTAFIKGSVVAPLAAEYVPEGFSVIGRVWNFGAGSGIAQSTLQEPGLVTYDLPGTFPLIYLIVDAQGRVAADTVQVEVVASAQPPVAEIYSPAADTAVSVGDSVYLEAVALQTAGRIVSLGWIYPPGSGLENRTDTVETPGWVVMDNPGVFPLRFMVSDLLGVSAADTVTVTVNDTLEAPVGSIVQPEADTTIIAGDSIFFSGQFTPAALVGVTHLWDWGSGSGLAPDSVIEPGWKVFDSTGTSVVTYTARDLSGRGAPDSVTITVDPNQPPLASIVSPASDIAVGLGGELMFEADDSDPEGRVAARAWAWDPASGIAPSPADSGRVAGTRSFTATGSFLITYHVLDDKGLEAADTVTVTVSSNQLPVARISSPSGDTTVYAWAPVLFAGTDSDGDGSVVSRQWDFGLADLTVTGDTTRNPGEVYFSGAGSYEVVYSVTDDKSTRKADTLAVTVNANSRPQAMIISPAGVISISAGDSLSLLATDFDPDGSVVSRVWTYGDGSGIPPDSVAIPDYRTFPNQGFFVLEYRVTDNVGGVSADSLLVTVGP